MSPGFLPFYFHCIRRKRLAPSLITFPSVELLLLNHAIHSRIRHNCEYFCTVAGPLASAETIQSGTELGAKTGRR